MTELRQRILFVLGSLVVFRIGTHIPVPGVDPAAVAAMFEQTRGSIVDIFNMFSGGALERLSDISAWCNALYIRLDHHSDDELHNSTA